MANPSKAKGTGGETELLRALETYGLDGLRRTSPGQLFDIERDGHNPVEALATRPDHGQWLVTVKLDDFAEMYAALDQDSQDEWRRWVGLRIEVKRYKRFSLHTIFEGKFGRD